MLVVAGSVCTQPPLHTPVTIPSTYPSTPGHGYQLRMPGEHAEGQAWVLGGAEGSGGQAPLHPSSPHPPHTPPNPVSAQTFHQDSQAGAQARAPQSLPACRPQEENSFQLNYPSHSDIITLQ